MINSSFPYIYPIDKFISTGSITIDKLPPIIIESSFSLETVVSSIIAALIPSLIAWKALSENYKLAKYQNKLAESKEWGAMFRTAIAEHVTDVNLLVSDITQWKEKYIMMSMGTSKVDTIPEDIKPSMRAAELSKNKILLLVGQTENHMRLIEKLIEIQDDISAIMCTVRMMNSIKIKFNKHVNEFIELSHLILEDSQIDK